MYQSHEFYKPEDNPTLAELMWERGLDPFEDKDCIAFGKSIAKFDYNIPQVDFEELLLEFVTHYLDERIGSGSLMQWMMHLRSYGMDRKGWYEDTYDLFKDIDKFAFLGRKVERDTNEDREKEEQGTVGTKRSEDEDNTSTLARDVNENATAINTRTQDDVLLGKRDRQEDVNKVNTNTSNSTVTGETTGNDRKTGDNKTTVGGSSSKTIDGTDTEVGVVTREDNKTGLSKTTHNENINDTQGEKVTTKGKTTDTTNGWDRGHDRKWSKGDTFDDTKTKTDDTETNNVTLTKDFEEQEDNTENTTTNHKENEDNTENTTTNHKENEDNTENTTTNHNENEDNTENTTTNHNENEDTTEDTTINQNNKQNTLKQNATGIGTATGPIGSGPGSFGSRAPSSGVVKDSTFEEGETIEDNHTQDVKEIDARRWGDSEEDKKIDGHRWGDSEEDKKIDAHRWGDSEEDKKIDAHRWGDSEEDKKIDNRRWGDSTDTTDGERVLDGFTETNKKGGQETNERTDKHNDTFEEKESKVDNEDVKHATVDTSKDGEAITDTHEETDGSDTIDKTFTKDTKETGTEDRTEDIKIDETTNSKNTENREETGTGESEESTAGNTLENVNDNRKVDEESNETRTNTTDIDEELFRKLRRMVEEDQERNDLSKETNKGTMVETTTGDVVPLMELARRYYDLRVSAKGRWVKDARKLFKYNYNF